MSDNEHSSAGRCILGTLEDANLRYDATDHSDMLLTSSDDMISNRIEMLCTMCDHMTTRDSFWLTIEGNVFGTGERSFAS